jgi:hypothetical protein
MRHRNRVNRLDPILCALAALMMLLAMTTATRAQSRVLSSNATISGAIEGVTALPVSIRSRRCASRRCHFQIPAINLTVSVAGHKNIAVSFDRVIDPRFIIRETNNQSIDDSLTRPLLLRGTARLRHAGPAGETVTTPVAAALYLSERTPSLEITLQIKRRSSSSSDGLVTVRAPLVQTHASFVVARARTLSSFALQGLSCGTRAPTHYTEEHHETEGSGSVKALATYDVLYMGTDFDSAWMTAVGCSSTSACHNKIVGLLNQAAVFYEQQLGLTLEVARQYGPTIHSSSPDSATLLYDFRAHNVDHRSDAIHNGFNSGENLIDLFQLFTGRKMDQKVVGIAFTGVMCDNASSAASHMVVSHKSDAADPVITAHEIGHTLNASHTTSGIMTAVLSSALPSSFNSLSVAEINSYYATYRSECRGGTGAGSPGSSTPGDPTSPPHAPGDNAPLPPPETMKLTVTKKGKDSYTIKTKVSVFRRGCVVSVRAGTSEDDAETGTVVLRLSPRSDTTLRKGRVPASIASSTPLGSTVYLTADYECPGNELLEVSPFMSISPNTGMQSSRKISRRAWINLFNKAF